MKRILKIPILCCFYEEELNYTAATHDLWESCKGLMSTQTHVLRTTIQRGKMDEDLRQHLSDGNLAPSVIAIIEEEGITSFTLFRRLRMDDLDLLYLCRRINHDERIRFGQLLNLRALLRTARQSQCPEPQQQGISILLLIA